MIMQDFQQRVVDEKTALDEKLSKLDAFILTDRFNKLPNAEQDRMQRQQKAMTDYSTVLSERVSAFS
jgi:hypothetical protein